jgi:hypothetical protein
VPSSELAPRKCCNSSAIPGPVTKNKLHMDSTKTNDVMILSLRSKICRAGKAVSPLYTVACESIQPPWNFYYVVALQPGFVLLDLHNMPTTLKMQNNFLL